MKPLPLEHQLPVERLKRFLQKNPDQARELAVNYFEDFLALANDCKKLQADFEALQSQLIQLQEQQQPKRKSPQLPSFL